MYALPTSADRAGHLCVPPDPGIGPAALATGEAAALGASESPAPGTGAAAALGASESASSGAGEAALSGTALASASLTFTLDSGASRSFFRDRTTLTPLGRPVAVSLADPSGGPVLAHFSTVLPCPAAPSGTLSGLYLPSFSTNLVSGADLQDAGVHQFTPASQRVTHCTDARTGRHLATFSRRPGSSLYTLTTESPPVPASGQVAASGSGPSCVPCVEGRLRATPHSSHFPPTEAPLQTLHMDVWGPAPVRGQDYERYFLLVVDDYSRYTTVLPLRSKGEVTEVLIDWIREARLRLRKSFGSDFPVLRLHSDRGGEFSSGLLRAYCRARGIRQSFTLPDSPQQNGIAERRIGMVMDVARTSMMHAAAPHFLWPFAVRYAAHQLNLHPRVSRPAMSPALLWTGKVGDASVFRVWGSRAFVRDLSADKLSPRAAPCVFLGFPTDASGWQFYHPSSRRVLSSQDVTFDESVPFYRLFPYRTPSLPPPPDFLVPVPPPVDPLPPQVPAPSGVSQVDAVDPVEVTGDSGAAAGAEPGGADSGGAVPGGAKPGGATAGGTGPAGATAESAEPGGAEQGGALPGGDGSGGAGSGAAEPGGAASGAAEPGFSPAAASCREPLSPQELREWVRVLPVPELLDLRVLLELELLRALVLSLLLLVLPLEVWVALVLSLRALVLSLLRLELLSLGFLLLLRLAGSPSLHRSCASGTLAAGGVLLSLEVLLELELELLRPSRVWVLPVPELLDLRVLLELEGTEGVGAEPTAVGPAARGVGGAGAVAEGAGAVLAESGAAARPRPYFSQSLLEPSSPLPAPSPYSGPTGGLAERREPASRPASPVRAARASGRGSRQRPPPVPGTHRMSLRPSTAPLRAPLPSPPESSLPALADPKSDSLRAASPTVTRLLATVVTDPSFESTAASALVAELVDFAARCRLDYAAGLVAESASVCPPSVGGECALGTDVLEDRQEELQCLAAASPHLASVLLAPEGDPDALDILDSAFLRGGRRGSPSWGEHRQWHVDLPGESGRRALHLVFKARYVARGFSQRQGVDYFQTFSPTPKMTTLRVLLHIAAQRDYELHSLDFSTAFLQVYGLRQAPREWHDTLRTTLAALGFAPSTADPSLFLRTDTSLPPFYILVYVDDLVFATATLLDSPT
ncbi:unnamed protein product [Closterium sp. NIES-65]|nr:unnamed protein product [Closterium sp. NIES-65]